jgi:hypothetical protein
MMKQQITHRRSILHIRHILEQFNGGSLTSRDAACELGVSRARLFDLRREWLRATLHGADWSPGVSGGNRHAPWPDGAVAFLRGALSGAGHYSYAFAASEMERLHGFRADRSQVRLWAVRNGLAHPAPKAHESRHWRRFQRTRIGELWQLDATPFAWFGHRLPQLPMLNMLDDCSRMQVGGCVYESECLAAYIHFLKNALEAYGLPIQIYVDQAAFFKSPAEGGTTRLKNRLAFYGVSFVYANSPEAKGKIERLHQVWQDRLPPFFAKNGVPADLGEGNAGIAGLLSWRNGHEAHRETGMTAQAAWDKALAEGRSSLRPVPRCPWWDYVWSEMARTEVLPRKRVRIGADEVSVNAPPGTRVVLCSHTDGFHTVLADWPKKNASPVILFSNRPRKAEPSMPPTVQF